MDNVFFNLIRNIWNIHVLFVSNGSKSFSRGYFLLYMTLNKILLV